MDGPFRPCRGEITKRIDGAHQSHFADPTLAGFP